MVSEYILKSFLRVCNRFKLVEEILHPNLDENLINFSLCLEATTDFSYKTTAFATKRLAFDAKPRLYFVLVFYAVVVIVCFVFFELFEYVNVIF